LIFCLATKTNNPGPSETTVAYAYDADSNMITNTGLGGGGAMTYPSQGAGSIRPHTPTAIVGAGATYDANGAMVSGLGRTLTWDGEGRAESVTKGGVTTTYAYGPEGGRVKKTVTGGGAGENGTTYYLGSDIEIAPDGTMTKIPRPDLRIVAANPACVLLRDQLGSVRIESYSGDTIPGQDAGQVSNRKRYAPFGDLTATSPGDGCDGGSIGTIGTRLDPEAGLQYLNARWYDPKLGRFLNPDWWDPIDEATALSGGAAGVPPRRHRRLCFVDTLLRPRRGRLYRRRRSDRRAAAPRPSSLAQAAQPPARARPRRRPHRPPAQTRSRCPRRGASAEAGGVAAAGGEKRERNAVTGTVVHRGDSRLVGGPDYGKMALHNPYTLTQNLTHFKDTYEYDDLCRPTRRDPPSGDWRSYSYVQVGNPVGQYIETRRPSVPGDPVLWSRAYLDGFGRVYVTADAGPKEADDPQKQILTETGYAARGTVAKSSAPHYDGESARYTRFEVDALDRPVRQELPDGALRRTSYDRGLGPAFDVVQTIDELGRRTWVNRDGYGRTIETVEQTGGPIPGEDGAYVSVSTKLAWSLDDHLVEVRDPLNNRWRATYDTMGRRTSVTDNDFGTRNYTYDAASRLVSEVDALSQRTCYDYDVLNRMTSKISRAGVGCGAVAASRTTTFAYDEVDTGGNYYNKGRLTSAANENGTVAIQWDAGGRRTWEQWTLAGLTGVKTFRTVFYPSGRVKFRTWPGGATTGDADNPWRYDRAGRLKAIPALITAIAYDAPGHETSVTYSNGSRAEAVWDRDRGWVDEIQHWSSASTSMLKLNYIRDLAGRITEVSASPDDDSWTYSYDLLDRLKDAKNPEGSAPNIDYAYDDASNMTRNSALGDGVFTYPTQGLNSTRPHTPTAILGSEVTYDANGAMVSGLGRTMTWDGEGRAESVTKGGVTTTYAYGPEGGRVKKTVVSGAVTETTFYLGSDIEIGPDGSMTTIPRPDIRIKDDARCILHRDQLGSVRVESRFGTEEAGQVSIVPSATSPSAR